MDFIKNSVNLSVGSIEEKREEIKKQFLQTYELDEKLFGLLKSTPMGKKKPLVRSITELIKVKIYRE